LQQIIDDMPGGFVIRSIATELPSIRADSMAAEHKSPCSLWATVKPVAGGPI